MSLDGMMAALPTADRARETRDMGATNDFIVAVGTGVQDRRVCVEIGVVLIA